MFLGKRSRRSLATFYCTAIAVGLYGMAVTCSSWLNGAPPRIVPAAIGLGALFVATIAVLSDGRRAAKSRPAGPRETQPPPSPAR